MRVAWEPRGLWEESAAKEAADNMGAVLVQDIAHEAPLPGKVLYSRLLALGRGGRVSLSVADVVAQRMREYEQAYVVTEGQGAREIQQALGLAIEDEQLAASDDGGLDDDKRHEAESVVRGRRDKGELQLPRFSADEIGRLRGKIDYPPKGAAAAAKGRS